MDEQYKPVVLDQKWISKQLLGSEKVREAYAALADEYEFVLRFQLPDVEAQPDDYLDALYEAGCDDALVGIGLPGYIGLDFCREAESASEAISSAIENTLAAIPDALLVEVTPDLLNLSEMADLISAQVQPVTRQAMRKYAFGQVAKMKTRFPPAAVASRSPLWHLDDVVNWLVENGKAEPDNAFSLIQTARTARVLNVRLQAEALEALDDQSLSE